MCLKLPIVVLITVPLFGEKNMYGIFGWLGVTLAILGFSLFQYLDYREYKILVEDLALNGTYDEEIENFRLNVVEKKGEDEKGGRG